MKHYEKTWAVCAFYLLTAITLCYSQSSDISGYVQTQRGRTRTTLDRATGNLVSTVETLSANHSGVSMQSPVDLAVGIQDGPAERIQVSGAQGGPGIGLYGSFYYRLSDIILEGQLRSGGFVAQQLEFVRNKKERFKYSLGPHATTYTEHPPVLMINGQQPYFVQEGDTLTLTMNASDPDGQVVMLSAAPNLGTARFDASNGVAASGTYTLDAIPPRRGHYSVAFEARDPTGLTDTETVMITVVPVNHPPTLSVPATVRVEEGQILTIPISGSDPDGDTVRLTAMPLPDHAVFIQSINSITFAPDYTQAGLYSIICQAHDGITSSLPAVVQVTVDDVTGGSQSNRLTLTVNPAESPTLVAGTRITGTVNSPSNPPPPQIISTALIVGVAPANARQGTVLDVSLTGKSTGKYVTHFIQDLSHADFGSGITVDSLIVTNSTQAIARISIDSAAVVGIRGIRVVSGDETSVAVPAFSIETGRTRVDGILRDPDTGLPLAGADIRIEGTLLSITTAPDGSFSFSDVPPGHHVLIVNANNHKLLRLEFDAEFGIVTDLGVLTSPTTVFDPTVSASVSLFSVLGRGIGELRPGKLTMEEARAVVRDTLLLLGGNEIGVYDAHGVQLNPEVDGDGLMSMKDKGVDNYAGQLVRGESVTLLEVLYDVSFAFAGYTNGTPPAFEEWLGILQQMVNKAWADPSDPFSAVAIVVFNPSRTMRPNPPVLSGYTRMTKIQAFIVMSGIMSALYTHHNDGIAWAEPFERDPLRAFGYACADLLLSLLSPPSAYAAPLSGTVTGVYTKSWSDIMVDIGTPTNAIFTTATRTNIYTLPALENVLSKYYLGGDTGSFSQVREVLLSNNVTRTVVDEIFDRDPYAVKRALSNLVSVSANNNAVLSAFQSLTDPSGHINLWGMMGLVRGPAFNYPLSQLVSTQPNTAFNAKVLIKSLAPGAPYIYSVREKRTTLNSASGDIDIPSVEISFYSSGDDTWPQPNPPHETFYYRLWRLDIAGTNQTTMQMVSGGMVADTSISGFRAPEEDPNAKGRRLLFTVPIPPAGMNQYRIDCVRGRKTAVENLDNEDLQKMKAWMSGYVDDPVSASLDQLTALGRRRIHPGVAFLKDSQMEFSALSNPGSVYVSGGGSGLAAFGRVDMHADYDTVTDVYLSIPSYTTNTNADHRGSGAVFHFDPTTGSITNLFDPGFMIPGQIGLAKDDDTTTFFTENGASEASYGGRIFRYDLADNIAAATNKVFVGSVNYYSRLINRANPAAVQSMIMGKPVNTNDDNVLFMADSSQNKIMSLPIYLPSRPEFAGTDVAWHNVSHPWAWTSTNTTDYKDRMNFQSGTDMTFNRNKTRLYFSQGSYVLSTTEGLDQTETITDNETPFVSASGVSICESDDNEYIFVADPGNGSILRLSVTNLPIVVPSDPAEKAAFINKHTFMSGLNNPTQVRIIDGNKAMVWLDQDGIHYHRFGYYGQVTNQIGESLGGIPVVLSTADNEITTTTDTNGVYFFSGIDSTVAGTIRVQCPDYPYVEEINQGYKCSIGFVTNRPVNLVPVVVIVSPPHGQQLRPSSVTVKGYIFPEEVDFSQAGGNLEISNGAGTGSKPLYFTGNGNEFVVSNVTMIVGGNFMRARINAFGSYQSAQSRTIRVRASKYRLTSQAVAGIARDGTGKPLPSAHILIRVDGTVASVTDADSFGYYHFKGLSCGTLTVEVLP